MRRCIQPRSRQGGAVAVITGLLVFVLVAFLGLVIDLGRLQLMKTELQNAADAAALAGAKELNGTRAGVTAAIAAAITAAGQNSFNFGNAVTITSADIWAGTCPGDDCMMAVASIGSDADAAGRTFLKVDTGPRTIGTLFMLAFGTDSVNTFGMAVAGRFTVQAAPIGVCAIDPHNKTAASGAGELLEFGFRRGIAYNIFELNPLGGAPGVPIWLNPVDSPPDACQPSNSSTATVAPYLCSGRSALRFTSFPANPGAYANTGVSAALERALNSRFENPPAGQNPSPCDMGSAPPDRNIKEYVNRSDIPGAPPPAAPAQEGHPPDWMEPGLNVLPSQQTISVDPATRKPVPAPTPAQYGALWSYSPAVQATGTPPRPGAAFATGDWPLLYNGSTADTSAGGYPTSSTEFSPELPPGSGTRVATPYSQDGGKYFTPPLNAGAANRRVLHIAIIDCEDPFPSGAPGLSCEPVEVLGIGRFLMQRQADLTGNPKRLDTEFGGLVDPLPSADIRLYR